MKSTTCLVQSLTLLLVTLPCLTSALDNQCAARTVLTYNTALIDHRISSGLPNNRMTRREAILTELRRVNADVVCLQEVWIGQDVERLVDALSDVYGYSHSKIHMIGKFGRPVLPDQTGPSMFPCNRQTAMPFYQCARRNGCISRSVYRVYQCLSRYCYHQFEGLSQECITCGLVSFQNARSVVRHCMGNGLPAYNARTMNSPGLLILSKTPLFNAKYTDYHPYSLEVVERGYLEADTAGMGKVVCTHNTNNLAQYLEMQLARRGTFRSYWEQGHAERTQLIAKFGNTNSLVLAGDFNTGDHFGPLINTNLPEEYCHMMKVFQNKPVSECTICWPHENIYNKNLEGIINTVVDHVFYRGHTAIDAKRVIQPTDAIIIDGLPLSDHNGVLVTLLVC